MPEFAHLHVHSDYSFLDGAATVQGLAARAAKLGMKSLALTDHGVMCGLMEFKKACEKHGIKPILGSEIYVVPHDMREQSPSDGEGKEYAHLVLLAENDTGYRNLTKIVSRAWVNGFYRKPRADYETLRAHSEGLIALTACLAGEVNQKLLVGKPKEAACKVQTYMDIFGKNNLYLEVQNHAQSHSGKVEAKVAGDMLALGKDLGVRCVVTNDSHFLNPEDFEAHNVMLCINMGKTMADKNRLEYGPDFYLKSPEEMATLFAGHQELLANTVEVAERCNVTLKRDQKFALPSFPCPEGMSDVAYLDKLCRDGLARLYGTPLPDVVRERYAFEFETLKRMGFASYYLITADFINWAKARGIPVGPGRGSAAGSIAAYALGITGVDPLKYNLLFERFLNPDRVSMPDMDIDFCQERRGEVIDYVRNKYGNDCVCQIGTFGKLLSRAALKDVGRVMGVPVARINAMTKKIEVKQGKVPTIDAVLGQNEELRREYEQDETIRAVWDNARKLEGMNRGTGVHAAGVVIAPSTVENYMPLMRQKDDENGKVVITTQYTMTEVENQGLLKMDFLGLRNLTIIQHALNYIKQDTGTDIDIGAIPLDHAPTYETLASGSGFGVFQLESEGMCRLLKSIKPTTFEDISAVLAIYRPGPLSAGVDKRFAVRKNGKEAALMPGEDTGVASPPAVEQLRKVLSDTYGLLIYQEQAMLISRYLGGFTPGEADVLRKAIGKKNEAEMNKLKPKFIDGCEKKGYGRPLGELLWNMMEGFGAYGFNKAHTVAYGVITYQTAWLKTNYPIQYCAALISSHIGNNDKIIEYVRGVRETGVQVLPPDINRSKATFSTDGNAIIFGLSGIKGAGTKAIEAIIEGRTKVGGAFQGFVHFLEHVDSTSVGRAVIEALIRGGAFDCFKLSRASLLESLDACLRLAGEAQQDAKRGQTNLFGAGAKVKAAAGKADAVVDEHARDLAVLKRVPEWGESERQRAEKEAFGFFLSSSPLDTHAAKLKEYATHDAETLQDEKPRRQVILGGLVRAVKAIKIKKESSRNFGRRMAKIELEDLKGVIQVMAFPDEFETAEPVLRVDDVVLIRGITEEGEEGIGVTLAEAIEVARADERFAGDPLIRHGSLFKSYSNVPIAQLNTLPDRSPVQLAGVAGNVSDQPTKNGKNCVLFNLASPTGSVKVRCMGRAYDAARELAKENAALVVRGSSSANGRDCTVFADEIIPFDTARKRLTRAVCVRLEAGEISRPLLENLREVVARHRGALPLFLRVQSEGGDQAASDLIPVGEEFQVNADPEFFNEIESALGSDRLEVMAKV